MSIHLNIDMNVKQEKEVINHWANGYNNEPPIGFSSCVEKSPFIIEFYHLHHFAIEASIYIISLLLLAVVVIVSVVVFVNHLTITKNLLEEKRYSQNKSLTDSTTRELKKEFNKTLYNNEQKSNVDQIKSENFGFAEIAVISARVVNHDEGSREGESDPFVTITLEYETTKKITENVIIDNNMYDNNEPLFNVECYSGYIPVNSSITFRIFDRDKDEDNPHINDELIGKPIKISILKDIVEQKLTEKQFIADIYSGKMDEKADYYLKFIISWKVKRVENELKCYE